MEIYKVRSAWSVELIAARSICEAEKKYDKLNRDIIKKDRKVISVELLGTLSGTK